MMLKVVSTKEANEIIEKEFSCLEVKNETVGLDFDAVKNGSPFELSGGQRRRVAIANITF